MKVFKSFVFLSFMIQGSFLYFICVVGSMPSSIGSVVDASSLTREDFISDTYSDMYLWFIAAIPVLLLSLLFGRVVIVSSVVLNGLLIGSSLFILLSVYFIETPLFLVFEYASWRDIKKVLLFEVRVSSFLILTLSMLVLAGSSVLFDGGSDLALYASACVVFFGFLPEVLWIVVDKVLVTSDTVDKEHLAQ